MQLCINGTSVGITWILMCMCVCGCVWLLRLKKACSHRFTSHHLQHRVPVLHTLLENLKKDAKHVYKNKTEHFCKCVDVSVPGNGSWANRGVFGISVLLTVCLPAVFWLVLLQSIMHPASVTVWPEKRWGSSRQIGLTVNKLIYSNKRPHPSAFVLPTTLHPLVQVSFPDGRSQLAVPCSLKKRPQIGSRAKG